MEKLDDINQLFVNHYKKLERKNDVEHLLYGTDDKLGQMWMEYKTNEQIAVKLLFDKKNSMYHFRSEKEYAKFDMEQAVKFAADTMERYHGCRCIAYDNKVILQLVGSYRNMVDKEAESKLEKSLEYYETDIRSAFCDFEKLCPIEKVENAPKEIQKEISGEEESLLTEEKKDIDEKGPRTEDIQVDFEIMDDEIIVSEDLVQDIKMESKNAVDEDANMVFEVWEQEKLSQEKELKELLSELEVLDDSGLGNAPEDKENTIQESRKEELLKCFQEVLESHGKSYETRVKGRYTGQYFEQDIRFSFRYHMEEDTDIMKIQASRKYPEQGTVLLEQWKELEQVDASVYKIKNEIIAIDRTLEGADTKQFLGTIEKMQCIMQQMDEVINNYQPKQEILSVQKPVHTSYDDLEKIYQSRELLLEQQRKETLDALRELNGKIEDVANRETTLAKQEKQLREKEITLSMKESELHNREVLASEKERNNESVLQFLEQKESSLKQKEMELQAKETMLQKEVHKNNEERVQNEQERERLLTEQKNWTEKHQERERLMGNLTIQIKALNEQKDDILSIIQLKSKQLYHGISLEQLEEELKDARKDLITKDEMIRKMSAEHTELESTLNQLQEDNIRLSRLNQKNMEEKPALEPVVSKEKYTEAVSIARRAASLCNEMKAEKMQLSEENVSLKNMVNILSVEKDRMETEKDRIQSKLEEANRQLQDLKQINNQNTRDVDAEQLKQQLQNAQGELDILKEQVRKAENGIVKGHDGVAVKSGQFIEYLKEQKGAADEMLEELHAADGNIVKIKGDLNIMVSLKEGMSFVECYTEEHISMKTKKKMEAYNAKNGKSILYSTGNRLYARTMFDSSASEEEIYHVMEQTTTIFESL